MTSAAFPLGRDVICHLGSRDPRRMTGRAIVDVYTQVVEADTREARKVVCHVARRAVQNCRHVVDGLPDTNVTVVTQSAIVYIDTAVVEYRTRKGHGVVANRTIIRCRNVAAELTQSNHIVMACLAVIEYIKMVISAGGEITRRMTNAAIFVCRHMVRRFAARRHTVTRGAIIHDTGVIKDCVGEGYGTVARSAVSRRRHVSRHRGSLSGSTNTVVVVVA